MRRSAESTACFRRDARHDRNTDHVTSIRRGFASSTLGRTRVITPSRISALILSASTARNPKAPPVGTDIVFAVDRLQPFIFVKINPALDRDHSVLNTHFDVVSRYSRHF